MLLVNPEQRPTGDAAPSRAATIRDVAQLAGLSHQTVSRYLRHGGDGVREAYRERIRTAIEDLGYRPNLAARAMRTRRTGRLAVLLPDGAAHSSVEVLQGASGTAREAGYGVDVLALSGEPAERRQRALELIDSGLFEGVLTLTPLALGPEGHTTGPTIVEFPLYDDEMHGIGALAEAAPIAELVERLADQGHRSFLHLAGSYGHESARRRRDAFLGAVSKLGLENFRVVECEWLPELAMQAVLDLPDDAEVTAVVAANDVLALGAIRGAHQRGWEVPGRLSVTGFDTSVHAAWMSPSLTSVQIDHPEIGRRAILSLLQELGPDRAGTRQGPAMGIVWRESTGPRPDQKDDS